MLLNWWRIRMELLGSEVDWLGTCLEILDELGGSCKNVSTLDHRGHFMLVGRDILAEG